MKTLGLRTPLPVSPGVASFLLKLCLDYPLKILPYLKLQANLGLAVPRLWTRGESNPLKHRLQVGLPAFGFRPILIVGITEFESVTFAL